MALELIFDNMNRGPTLTQLRGMYDLATLSIVGAFGENVALGQYMPRVLRVHAEKDVDVISVEGVSLLDLLTSTAIEGPHRIDAGVQALLLALDDPTIAPSAMLATPINGLPVEARAVFKRVTECGVPIRTPPLDVLRAIRMAISLVSDDDRSQENYYFEEAVKAARQDSSVPREEFLDDIAIDTIIALMYPTC